MISGLLSARPTGIAGDKYFATDNGLYYLNTAGVWAAYTPSDADIRSLSLTKEIQSLSPTALIELFVLDMTAAGQGFLYFHAGTNQLVANVVWQGHTYSAMPIEAEGFAAGTTGTLPRPKIRLANIDGAFSSVVAQYNDLIGYKLTRKRTFQKYLDAVNFPERVNMITYSENLGHPVGWINNANITVSVVNNVDTPDGVVSCDKLILASGISYSANNSSGARPGFAHSAGTYTMSVYAKASEITNLVFRNNWTGANPNFDLLTGLVTQGTGVSKMVSAGNGWWRCICTYTLDATQASANNGISYRPFKLGFNGDGVSGIYVRGAQINVGGVELAYQKIDAAPISTANPSQCYPDDVWYIDQKISENRYVIEWELASPADLIGVMLPARQVNQNSCPWAYKGAECGYNPATVGNKMYDSLDVQVLATATDVCGKRLASCQARFGITATLPYGGYPGAISVQ